MVLSIFERSKGHAKSNTISKEKHNSHKAHNQNNFQQRSSKLDKSPFLHQMYPTILARLLLGPTDIHCERFPF